MKKIADLWYAAPAQAWTEALPLGNGRIGAMMFSEIFTERIALNEDTLWSGYPKDTNRSNAHVYYAQAQQLVRENKLKEAQNLIEDHMLGGYTESYVPLGDLTIEHTNLKDKEATAYKRSLDLNRAVCTACMTVDGITYTRSSLVSRPDEALICNIQADHPASVHLRISIKSQVQYQTFVQGNQLVMDVRCPSHAEPSYLKSENPIIYDESPEKMGMRARTLISVQTQGGQVRYDEDSIIVEDADSATIALCIRTSFNGFDKQPETQGCDEKTACAMDMDALIGQSFDLALQRHLDDYQPLFERVGFELDMDCDDSLPTDKRLAQFGQTQNDPLLFEQIFQYGRYLLISCSREGTQAANLQGIWNQDLRPAWSANFTVNINTEMNYWPTEICNMAELHMPLFDLIDNLRVTGAKTAKEHYNARGCVSHHNVDLWALSNPVGNGNRNTAGYAFWPMSFGWLCRHLFEHYEYSLDKEFLKKRALPAISDAAKFFIDVLVQNHDGNYTISPATSPENSFLYDGVRCSVSQSATMSNSIVREVFENYLACGEILGIEEEDMARVRELLPQIAPFKIGSQGQLLEWEAEFEEVEVHHRHVSHLYGLHPARQITPEKTAELTDACKRSLEIRGDDGTGWSLGWKINMWARLLDGNHALKLLKRQLRLVSGTGFDYMSGGGTYPNLFDAHPPFQIDGNFGTCAGIAELFLQSYGNTVKLLPALPSEWQKGSIRGLRAIGGLTVDILFEEGALLRATLYTSVQIETPICISYGGKEITLVLEANRTYSLQKDDFV